MRTRSARPTASLRASIIPDLNPGDKSAEERFKKVQEAYDILSDPKKKQMYDQYGFYSENGMPAGGAWRRGRAGAGPNMGFGGFDFSDVFARRRRAVRGGRHTDPRGVDQFPGHLQPVVWPRRTNRTATAPEKGTDLEYGLNIDFWQAIRGTQVRLKINRQEACASLQRHGSARRARTRFVRNATAAGT